MAWHDMDYFKFDCSVFVEDTWFYIISLSLSRTNMLSLLCRLFSSRWVIALLIQFLMSYSVDVDGGCGGKGGVGDDGNGDVDGEPNENDVVPAVLPLLLSSSSSLLLLENSELSLLLTPNFCGNGDCLILSVENPELPFVVLAPPIVVPNEFCFTPPTLVGFLFLKGPPKPALLTPKFCFGGGEGLEIPFVGDLEGPKPSLLTPNFLGDGDCFPKPALLTPNFFFGGDNCSPAELLPPNGCLLCTPGVLLDGTPNEEASFLFS